MNNDYEIIVQSNNIMFNIIKPQFMFFIVIIMITRNEFGVKNFNK